MSSALKHNDLMAEVTQKVQFFVSSTYFLGI